MLVSYSLFFGVISLKKKKKSKQQPSKLPNLTTMQYDYYLYWLNTAAAAKSLQSCPTLCDPTDSSPPGFPVPETLQARALEWVAISFSNAWKWKVKVKSLSRVLT